MRVGGGPGAGLEDEVVTGALPFHQHLPGGQPDQRVEPEQGAGGGGDALRQDVAAADVSDFVDQDLGETLFVPGTTRDREDHDGSKDAPRHWRLLALAPAEGDAAGR